MAYENPREHEITRLASIDESTASAETLLAYLEEVRDAVLNLQWMVSTLAGAVGSDGVLATGRLNGVQAGMVDVHSPLGMKVTVKAGVFIADNTPFMVEANYTSPDFVAPVTTGYTRIDVIAAADTYSDPVLSAPAFVVVEGVEGASPTAPAVSSGMVKLAEVCLRVGMSQIDSADVSPHAEGYVTDSRNLINV